MQHIIPILAKYIIRTHVAIICVYCIFDLHSLEAARLVKNASP